jgi:hypothetical protein
MYGRRMPPNARALTRAEISLADWHRLWRHGFFVFAIGWMLLSAFALHWMITLTGIPSWAAWAGAFFYEGSVAGIATTATTARKPDNSAHRSPWLGLVFFVLIAQICNVFHALVSVSGRVGELPPWIPTWLAYTLAGALAALFPLGGMMLVHMSGFLRAHGADAQWVDPDAQRVLDATAHRAPRTARIPRPDVRSDDAEPRALPAPIAPTHDAEPEPVALSDDERALPPRDRARLLYDRMTVDGATPTASAVARAFASAGGDGTVHPSTVRRWVEQFRAEPTDSNGAHSVTAEELERILDDAQAV